MTWFGLKIRKKTSSAFSRGPNLTILNTPTALRVAEIHPWIHHSTGQRGHPNDCPWWTSSLKTTLNRQCTQSPALITPGSCLVEAWLKSKQTVYTGISIFLMYYYSFEFLVFFPFFSLDICRCILDCILRGLGSSKKVCFLLSYLVVIRLSTLKCLKWFFCG